MSISNETFTKSSCIFLLIVSGREEIFETIVSGQYLSENLTLYSYWKRTDTETAVSGQFGQAGASPPSLAHVTTVRVTLSVISRPFSYSTRRARAQSLNVG